MLTNIERILFLRGVDLFASIPDETLAQIAQAATVVHFIPGEQFIEQGDVGDCLYIIIDGEVEIFIDGRLLTQRGPRDVIGELAILDSLQRRASCVAATETAALKIEQEDFWLLMEDNPELVRGIIRVLIKSFEEVSHR